ncbi:MAG: DUF6527 family protein [Chloroflexota bacterium]|nr:DUF6527 family protein [Chloroflexota bacterium]
MLAATRITSFDGLPPGAWWLVKSDRDGHLVPTVLDTDVTHVVLRTVNGLCAVVPVWLSPTYKSIWQWDGHMVTPTLCPALSIVGASTEWHGWLQEGRWVPTLMGSTPQDIDELRLRYPPIQAFDATDEPTVQKIYAHMGDVPKWLWDIEVGRMQR